MKKIKLENVFENSIVQYVIELFSELVVKLFNIGVSQIPTLDGHCIVTQYFCALKIISFASEKRDSGSH
jgi:hypothetical protein